MSRLCEKRKQLQLIKDVFGCPLSIPQSNVFLRGSI